MASATEQPATEPAVQAARDRGIGPWLDFGDVEDQLRVVQPVAVRKEVPAPMVPFYRLLAAEHGYRVEGVAHDPAAVRVVLLRRPGAADIPRRAPGGSQKGQGVRTMA